MKYVILVSAVALLLSTAPGTRAHNLVSASGKTQDHQHVYRRQEYGKPLQQGHRIQAAGANGMIIWGSDMRPAYGSSSVRRSGPIIDDQNPGPRVVKKSRKKYGSAVNNYGKPVNGYGKAVRDYGKSGRDE